MLTPITHYTIAVDALKITLRHNASRPVDSIELTKLTLREAHISYRIASTTLTRLNRCPKSRYRVAYSVDVDGQCLGRLFAIPSHPEVSDPDLLSFEFDNSILYGSWLPKYQVFKTDLHLDFNSFTSVDLAADCCTNLSQVVVDYLRNTEYDCRSQRKPVIDERNLGHYNNPIVNEIETLYIGKRGKRDNPVGASQLTVYNKSKLLNNEEKPWIEKYHQANQLSGTIYRAEVRLTNQALNRIDYIYTPLDCSLPSLSAYQYKQLLKQNSTTAKSYRYQAVKQSADLTMESLTDPQQLQVVYAHYFSTLLDIRRRTDVRFTRCTPISIFDFTRTPKLIVNRNIYNVQSIRNTNMKRTIKTMIHEAFTDQESALLVWAEYLARKHQLMQYYQKELSLVGGVKAIRPPKTKSILGLSLPGWVW